MVGPEGAFDRHCTLSLAWWTIIQKPSPELFRGGLRRTVSSGNGRRKGREASRLLLARESGPTDLASREDYCQSLSCASEGDARRRSEPKRAIVGSRQGS